MENRETIRQHIKKLRAKLPIEFQQQAAQKLANIVEKTDVFKTSKTIAFYLPVAGELDPQTLIRKTWKKGNTCYLPIVNFSKKLLLFGKYNNDSKLLKNRLNILEPNPEQTSLISPKELDLVITPLVAFDQTGNRLGTGGGYYDRTFSFKQKEKRPILAGVGYNMQQVSALKSKPWDIQLDIIITETGIKYGQNYAFTK